MKLIIFPGNYIPHMGGLETHVDEFCKFASKKYEITIFTPHIPGSSIIEKRHTNVHIIRYPSIKLIDNYFIPRFWSPSFWRIWNNLKKTKYDLVMTRTRFFWNSFLGARFARSVPLIHVEHGSGFIKTSNPFVNYFAWLYDMTIGRYVLRKAIVTVSISRAVQRFLKKEFGLNNTPIITRGIDFTKYDAVKVSRKKEHIFGVACRLTKWKGVSHAIDAMKDLPVTFWIMGDGEDLDQLKKKAKNNPCIQFLGRLSEEEVILRMKQMQYYVHSSGQGGGLSNSLLQAMYCGCTVIASPGEGADEVISAKTGILLKDNSAVQLRKGIQKALKTKGLGKNAKAFVSKEFDWNVKIKEYDQLFERVIKKRL
ncbi:MAG: glycosyltransferase family 4 protein [Candidatus Woesearchaeota archaeon]